MNISLKRRLVRLERWFALEAPPENPERIAEQWLTIYQQAKGDYATEPDFPAPLLALSRQ